MRLHAYPEIIDAVLEAAEAQDGLLTPEQVSTLDSALGGLHQKARSLIGAIRHFEGLSAAAKEERKRLASLEASFARRADSLRAYLKDCMRDEAIDRVVTEIGGVSRCKASRPTIRWTWAGDPPADYARRETVVKLDHEALLEAWKAGCLPEGFEATLEEVLRLR